MEWMFGALEREQNQGELACTKQNQIELAKLFLLNDYLPFEYNTQDGNIEELEFRPFIMGEQVVIQSIIWLHMRKMPKTYMKDLKIA